MKPKNPKHSRLKIVSDEIESEGDCTVTMLSAGGALDTFRAHMLAELLVARAEALVMQDRGTEAAAERERARTLLTAVLPVSEGATAARVSELLGWLSDDARAVGDGRPLA